MPFDPSTATPGFDPSTVAPDNAEPEGHDLGKTAAFAHSAADTATFGLMDRALSNILPSSMWASYRANMEATQADHPLLTLVGEGTGMLAGGGVLGAAARGLKAVPLVGAAVRGLEMQKGQTIRNAARLATGGAVAGGTTQALSDPEGTAEDPTHALIAAGIGAVGGPVAGVVAQKAAPFVGRALGAVSDRIRSAPLVGNSIPAFGLSAEQSGWAKLADKLNIAPDDLTKARNNYAAWTGAEPSIPEIMDMQGRGQLQKLAAANPEIAEKFAKLDDTERTTGITLSNLTKQRDMNMDAAMGAIRDDKLPLSPYEQQVLLQEYVPNSGMAKGNSIRASIINDAQNGHITVGNVDIMRQNLGRMAGSSVASEAVPASERGKLLTQWAEGNHAGYKTAMDNYRSDSQVIDGFNHGLKGKNIADVDDPLLQASLAKPTGQAGYNVGILTKQGRDNISDVVPGKLSEGDQASLAGHAAGGFLSHSMAMGAYHISKLTAARLRLPPQVADRIGEALSDPKQTTYAIQMLRNAGATNADIRSLAIGSALSAGINLAGTQTDPLKGAALSLPGASYALGAQ